MNSIVLRIKKLLDKRENVRELSLTEYERLTDLDRKCKVLKIETTRLWFWTAVDVHYMDSGKLKIEDISDPLKLGGNEANG